MNNWVVANLDEGVSTGVGVGTGDKVGPVTDRAGAGSPDASFISSSGRVNVVARMSSESVTYISRGQLTEQRLSTSRKCQEQRE